MARFAAVFAALAGTVACATTPGAQPHDMSAAQHEREAQAHELTEHEHAAQHDPNASVERERCAPSGQFGGADQTCWTSVQNPTAEHQREADAHRKHAADHRAASKALRDAEAQVCRGIASDDRDISPFWHRDDITGVAPLSDKRASGATITFRAVPGMTAEWLQRVVDCHLARNASLGHVVPDMPDCPLVPKGARATVRSTGDGFSVTVVADDPRSGREIAERAERLVGNEK